MSQELHILQCYSCETFQVHIVKKTNKWDCKICGERQSIKKVFGRGSGKDCRAHVQRLNEDKRRKESFVLKRGIKVQSAQNAAAMETNVPYVMSSKWNKYLSEDEEDCSDDSMTMSPSELRISSKSKLCEQQPTLNYSASGPINNICGEEITAVPENWTEKFAPLNEIPFTENEDLSPHAIKSSLPYFSTEKDTCNKNKLSGKNQVCQSQRSLSPLCFALLPETSTTTALLDCDIQQEILSDSSDGFASTTWNTVFIEKELSVTEVRDSTPHKCEIKRQEEEKATVQLQSDIHGSYVTDSGSEARNFTKNVKQIFSDKYNEDELDEILKF